MLPPAQEPQAPSHGSAGVSGLALAEGILALSLCTGEAELYETLLHWAQALYPARYWAVAEMRGEPSSATEVEILAHTRSMKARFKRSLLGERMPVMGRGFSVKLYREREVVFVPEAPLHPEEVHPDFVASLGLRSLLGIPLIFEERSVGGLYAASFEGEAALPEEPAAFNALLSLSRATAMALHRLRALQGLALSEERYRRLFDQSVEPILIGDRSGYLMVNEAAARLVRRPREAILGQPLGSFSPEFQPGGRSSSDLAEEFLERARAGEALRFDWVVERSDGTLLDTEVTLALLPGGDRPLYQVILRDLTEAKRAQAEKEALERQLFQAQKLESLGVLAGGVAHDFNNLLMGVMGHAGLALDHLDPGPELRGHLEAIQNAGRRAADLTRQMLAYSGRGQFHIQDLDLSRQVEEMLPLLEVSMAKSIHVDLDLRRDLPLILGDATQVQQVVMNLVLNAGEAIGEDPGTIRVSTGVLRLEGPDLADLVEGREREPGPYVFLDVTDTGAGMDASTLARIFEPFFTTKFTGRGLGLSALLGIVKGHGGMLDVRSSPGAGATFRVFFPPAPEAVLPPRPLPPEPKPPEPTRSVLVVDDEPAVRIVARRILEASGFSVVEAEDGLEGTEVFAAGPEGFRFVVLDLSMPRMGGVEALRRMRALRPGLPVLLCSGFGEEVAAEGLSEGGPGEVLTKPYGPREMRAALRRILNESILRP